MLKRHTKIQKWLLSTAMLALCTVATQAYAQQSVSARQDALVLEASAANQRGDTKKLLEILPQVKGHPMEPWVDYWAVRTNIKNASAQEVRGVFQRWPGVYVEDRLRNDWLLVLGERGDWDTFSKEYAYYKMRDDSQVMCYALLIDHRHGYNATPQALKEFTLVSPNWVSDTGCNKLASVLYQEKKMPESAIWTKARRLAELNQNGATQQVVAIIDPSLSTTVRGLMSDPTKWLKSQTSSTASKTAVGATQNELVTLALIRLAVKDPESAVSRLRAGWSKHLNADQKAWVYGAAGRIMAIRLEPMAVNYFDQSEAAQGLNDDVELWRARARLRAAEISKKPQDWQKLINTIEKMPQTLRTNAAWVYWKAIALKKINPAASGDGPVHAQVNQLLESIAGYGGFYEQLATEELGRRVKLPATPVSITDIESKQVKNTPGFNRAIYALRMGLRSEGLREWNWSLIGYTDRQLQAASQLACDNGIWDRCINTSERAKTLDNISQRFPLPYRDLVSPRATEIGLDPAYVFGLIRQESRFIADIKSSVGASGLMQLMPKTAKWTAKEIGMTDYNASMVTDPKTNIALGTAYLKLSVDEFDGSELLAAAGYNAGPGRPRRWRNGPEIDGAVWAENVPFNETRSYVQTVLAAAVVYDTVLNDRPQTLRQRLGRVGTNKAASDKRKDLP